MLSIGNKMPAGIVKRSMFQAKTKPLAQPQFSALFDTFRSQETIDAREAEVKVANEKHNTETAKGFQYLLTNWSNKPVSINLENKVVTVGGRKFTVEREEDRLADTLKITAQSHDGQVSMGIVRIPEVMLEKPFYSTTIIDKTKGIELHLRDNISPWDTATVPQVHVAAESLLKQMSASL